MKGIMVQIPYEFVDQYVSAHTFCNSYVTGMLLTDLLQSLEFQHWVASQNSCPL